MDDKKLDDLLYYGGIGFGVAGIILLCVNLIFKPEGSLCQGVALVCVALSNVMQITRTLKNRNK